MREIPLGLSRLVVAETKQILLQRNDEHIRALFGCCMDDEDLVSHWIRKMDVYEQWLIKILLEIPNISEATRERMLVDLTIMFLDINVFTSMAAIGQEPEDFKRIFLSARLKFQGFLMDKFELLEGALSFEEQLAAIYKGNSAKGRTQADSPNPPNPSPKED